MFLHVVLLGRAKVIQAGRLGHKYSNTGTRGEPDSALRALGVGEAPPTPTPTHPSPGTEAEMVGGTVACQAVMVAVRPCSPRNSQNRRPPGGGCPSLLPGKNTGSLSVRQERKPQSSGPHRVSGLKPLGSHSPIPLWTQDRGGMTAGQGFRGLTA